MGAPRSDSALKLKPGPAEVRERLIDKGSPEADTRGAWEAAAGWGEAQGRALEKDSGFPWVPAAREPPAAYSHLHAGVSEFPRPRSLREFQF